jgi:thiamine kinase-like enzyme
MPDDAELIELAAHRLGIGEPAVERLAGGSRNRCYVAGGTGRKLVLRIAGEGDRAYAVARAAESLAQRAAAAQGLAPAILLEEPELGLTVMEWAEGGVWSRGMARSPAGAACLGRWLRRLHAMQPPAGMRQVDFASSLDHYARELDDDASARALVGRAKAAAARLGNRSCGVLCHNDLHHLNIIGSLEAIQVVDWEYAGLGNPIMDLAGYLAYHDLDASALSALLDAYGEGPAAPSPARLADARWLFEAVWWAWLELHRRLCVDEDVEFREARQRLVSRLASGAG